MTFLALALVVTSAFMHASWNYFAKRAGGGVVFTWLFAALTTLIYTPVGIFYWRWQQITLNSLTLVFIFGSAVIHLVYFLLLQRGYRTGDLSLVYPLARGSGLLLATLGAVLLLGERPSALALTGTLLIVGSVFTLTGGRKAFSGGQKQAVVYGLATGVCIAIYTVWDDYAVSRLAAPPLIFMWLSECCRALLLAPSALRNPQKLREVWRQHRLEAVVIAVLSPLAYILVLTALTFTPISYVAPTREISILIGAILGARLLAEGDVRRRLWAASGMVVGVVLLAFG